MAADATITMKYNADTSSATGSMNTFGSSIKKIGTMMATVFSIKAIYEIGSAFEKSFAKASTLIDKTSVSMSALKDGVLELSNDTGVAADEINEGLYQALSAGVDITEDGSDALGFMNKMLKLATGGFTDTATAVDATTTIMNAYGLSQSEAATISDQLIATQNEGKTTVAELGGTLSQVIPIAAQLGIEYDQVGASLATLTANGDSTSEASTKMKALFNELSKSTTEVGTAFERVAGQSFTEFIASGGTVSEAMSMMQDYADDTGVGISELFSSVEAGSAAATIASKTGLAKFDESLEAITNSAGDTDAAFNEVSNTASYKMEKAFNKMKNAGIQTFGALAPAINLVASVLSLVATGIQALLSGFKDATAGAQALGMAILVVVSAITLAATSTKVLLGSMAALVVIFISIIQAAQTGDTVMQLFAVGLSVIIGLIIALKVHALITAGAFTVLGIAINTALWPVLLIIAGIAALIAILAIFVFNKSDEQKAIEETTKAMKEEREAMDDTIDGYDDTAAASKVAAKSLVDLSKKFKKGEATISQMQTQVDALNDALGDDVVSVDEATGAIKVYGKEVDNAQEVLDGLIDLQNAQSKASEYQGKLNDALAKKEEAQIALQKQQAGEIELTRGEINTYNEMLKEAETGIAIYSEGLAGANNVIEEQTAAMDALNLKAAEGMTEEQKRQAIREQLNSDRELSTEEHNAKLQEMMASNYAELGLTEEEYITQMAEHQQAIEDATAEHQQKIEQATQEHVDTLFGINEEGLYNEAKTVEEMNAMHNKSQEDMANYYSNLNGLADEGWDNLVWYFEQGGVETGGTLQNTMDDLQGIGLDEWSEIQTDWEANGNKLSSAMKEKYGDINVEAGLGVLEWSGTIKKGLEDGAKYGVDAVDPMVGGMETTYEDVNTAVETGGEAVAETSAEAGADAAQSYVSAVEDNLGDVETIGKLTGNSYVNGLLAGLEAMRSSLRSKARSLAYSMNYAYQSALDISSPSKIARWNSQMYGKGAELGLEDSKKGVEDEAADLANTIINASQLVYTPPFMGAAGTSSYNYTYYNDNQTDNRQEGPLLNIENYNQNSDQDQDSLMQKIEIARRQRVLAVGAPI